MVGDKVNARPRNKRRQAFDKREWIEHDVSRPVSPGSAQRVDDFAFRVVPTENDILFVAYTPG